METTKIHTLIEMPTTIRAIRTSYAMYQGTNPTHTLTTFIVRTTEIEFIIILLLNSWALICRTYIYLYLCVRVARAWLLLLFKI